MGEKTVLEIIQKYSNKKSPLSQYPDSNPVWITKDGKRIPLADMTTNHITNCLSKFRKYETKNNRIQEWEKLFEEELSRRGERKRVYNFMTQGKSLTQRGNK